MVTGEFVKHQGKKHIEQPDLLLPVGKHTKTSLPDTNSLITPNCFGFKQWRNWPTHARALALASLSALAAMITIIMWLDFLHVTADIWVALLRSWQSTRKPIQSHQTFPSPHSAPTFAPPFQYRTVEGLAFETTAIDRWIVHVHAVAAIILCNYIPAFCWRLSRTCLDVCNHNFLTLYGPRQGKFFHSQKQRKLENNSMKHFSASVWARASGG